MANPVFARHETFHPRYGWMRKGFDAAKTDSRIFLRNDAHISLGVGKNMARSIRYWCHAFKLLKEEPEPGSRRKISRTTTVGDLLLGPNGLDPYLESLASLWYLHWKLLHDPCMATAWRYLFFGYARPDFTVDELVSALAEHVRREHPGARTAASSLRKDVSCIIRMYAKVPNRGKVNEQTIQCPFAELEILRPSADQRSYRFLVGPKRGLSDHLITATALEFANVHQGQNVRTVSLRRLLRDVGSPGMSFRLAEGDLYGALERAVQEEDRLSLADAGGVVHLAFDAPPEKVAREFILRHYDPPNSRRKTA